MAVELAAGAGLGTLFGALYEGVKFAMRKTVQFKPLLGALKLTLDSLQPLIFQQIGDLNVQLGLSNEDLEMLERQMEEGVKLVLKLSKVRIWDCCNWSQYTDNIIELDGSLKVLSERLRVQATRDVKETLLLARQNAQKLVDLEKINRRLLEILQVEDPRNAAETFELAKQTAVTLAGLETTNRRVLELTWPETRPPQQQPPRPVHYGQAAHHEENPNACTVM